MVMSFLFDEHVFDDRYHHFLSTIYPSATHPRHLLSSCDADMYNPHAFVSFPETNRHSPRH
jgi:hypothetical protein